MDQATGSKAAENVLTTDRNHQKGSDYNLLLVSRFKEEIQAGIKIGIIRSMAGTGAVVTSAGLVFAFTMLSFGLSALMSLAQVGRTIGMGLPFDTLVVRSFMTPSIAALMGRWFWWPQRVRSRPVPRTWSIADVQQRNSDLEPQSSGLGFAHQRS